MELIKYYGELYAFRSGLVYDLGAHWDLLYKSIVYQILNIRLCTGGIQICLIDNAGL
jgi:hypothetical protein